MTLITDPTGYAPSGPLEAEPTGPFTDPWKRTLAITRALEGVEVGEYDQRIIRWLTELDDPTCRTLVSLIWRARAAERS